MLFEASTEEISKIYRLKETNPSCPMIDGIQNNSTIAVSFRLGYGENDMLTRLSLHGLGLGSTRLSNSI